MTSDVRHRLLGNPEDLGLGPWCDVRRVVARERELDAKPESVAEVLGGSADQVAEARVGVRRAAQGGNSRARIAKPDVDRRDCVMGRTPGLHGQAVHARQLAGPQLRQPEVLRQPVVQLARQPCALLERRPFDVGVAQLGELDVCRPQLAETGPDRALEAEQQGDGTRQPQQVGGRDLAGMGARVEGPVQLAQSRRTRARWRSSRRSRRGRHARGRGPRRLPRRTARRSPGGREPRTA